MRTARPKRDLLLRELSLLLLERCILIPVLVGEGAQLGLGPVELLLPHRERLARLLLGGATRCLSRRNEVLALAQLILHGARLRLRRLEPPPLRTQRLLRRGRPHHRLIHLLPCRRLQPPRLRRLRLSSLQLGLCTGSLELCGVQDRLVAAHLLLHRLELVLSGGRHLCHAGRRQYYAQRMDGWKLRSECERSVQVCPVWAGSWRCGEIGVRPGSREQGAGSREQGAYALGVLRPHACIMELRLHGLDAQLQGHLGAAGRGSR